MSLPENFLRLRAKSGFTQEDVARRLEVSRQSVAKWEAGKSTPDLEKLIALADLFDVSLDELVRGHVEMTSGEVPESAPDRPDASDDATLPEASASAQSKAAYLAHMGSFARMIGAGVGFCILGAAFSVFFDLLGSFASGNALFDLLESVGLGSLQPVVADSLAGISGVIGGAVGIALLIPAGIGHGDYMKRHPVLDFEFSEREQGEARRILIVHLTIGLALIFLGVVVVIALSPGGESWEQLGTAIMLVFVATGVEELIYGGIRGSATEKHEYETDAAEALLESGHPLPAELDPAAAAKAQRNRIVGAICGIIMIIATIVGLTLLFAANASFFWLAWVIGGLTCGIVSLAGDALIAARAG